MKKKPAQAIKHNVFCNPGIGGVLFTANFAIGFQSFYSLFTARERREIIDRELKKLMRDMRTAIRKELAEIKKASMTQEKT